MRLLVTGDRNGFDYDRLWEVLDALLDACRHYGDKIVLIEGGAKGVDTQARDWALSRRIEYEEYPAEWNTYGRRAGPIRNNKMLKEGKPDKVVAFHRDISTSKGTANMVHIAQRAGIDTVVISH